MRFFLALIFSSICFAGIDEHLISTPEASIRQGISLDKWLDDFVEAKKIAKGQNKRLLIAFLGPNWCSWSDKLEEDILGTQLFTDSLKKEVVFVKVEIPADFEESDFVGKDLKTQYGINECPTLVLAESSGNAIAKLDYLPVQNRDFIHYIQQTLSDYRRISQMDKKELKHLKVDELQYLYAHAGRFADETFKHALLKQGLKVDRGSYFLLEEYGEMLSKGNYEANQLNRVRHKILIRDPENMHGCLRKLAVLDFEAMVNQKNQQRVAEVVRPLIDYLSRYGETDTENAWQLEMKIAKYCFTKDHIQDALKHAQASLAKAPESAKKDISQSIEFLKTRIN